MVVKLVAQAIDTGNLADPDQFRAFYSTALPRVYGYFYLRLGADGALAEDLTQETFLSAVAELQRGTAVESPVPWILGVARHKLLDHFRRKRRIGWTFLSWETVVEDDGLIATEEHESTTDQAITALAGVPSPQREALVLKYLDGLAVPEVAAALGRSVHATESLLARGRVTFRHRLQETIDE